MSINPICGWFINIMFAQHALQNANDVRTFSSSLTFVHVIMLCLQKKAVNESAEADTMLRKMSPPKIGLNHTPRHMISVCV